MAERYHFTLRARPLRVRQRRYVGVSLRLIVCVTASMNRSLHSHLQPDGDGIGWRLQWFEPRECRILPPRATEQKGSSSSRQTRTTGNSTTGEQRPSIRPIRPMLLLEGRHGFTHTHKHPHAHTRTRTHTHTHAYTHAQKTSHLS